MLQAELPHIALVQKQRLGIFFSRDRGRVVAIIKYRHLRYRRAGAFDMNDLFAAVTAFPESAYRAFDNYIQSARFVAGNEDDFVFAKAARHRALSNQLQSLIVQFMKQTGLLQGSNLIEGHSVSMIALSRM